LETGGVNWPPRAVSRPGQLVDMSFVLDTVFQPGTARSCGIRIRTGDDEYTEIGYDRADGVVYVDRRRSGNVGFHASFPGRHEAPTRIIEGQVTLQVILDRSSIEVFINDGEAVISDRLFPSSQTPVIEAFAGDATAQIVDMTVTPLQSIWHR
jgi:sucrose-6-phosphate hydrolase SacC (GH32 family)